MSETRFIIKKCHWLHGRVWTTAVPIRKGKKSCTAAQWNKTRPFSKKQRWIQARTRDVWLTDGKLRRQYYSSWSIPTIHTGNSRVQAQGPRIKDAATSSTLARSKVLTNMSIIVLMSSLMQSSFLRQQLRRGLPLGTDSRKKNLMMGFFKRSQ